MGIAESLKIIVNQLSKSAADTGEAKEIFNDVLKKCLEETGCVKTSLDYHFSGYGYQGNKVTGYKPPVEEVVKILEEEGFKVTVKTRDITHREAYGPTPLNFCDEAREIDSEMVGTEYFLEIEW